MAEDKGAILRALHKPGDPFVLANAWDAGSARLLVALGAQAIGTTSSGHAFTLGRGDNAVSRDEALTHAAELVAAEKGSGMMIMVASKFQLTDIVIMGIIVIGVIGYTIDILMRKLENWMVPWKGKA